METAADTLATATELGQPRQLPSPQTGALTTGDTGVDALAAPPSMGQTMAQNTIAAGQVNNGNPRDWAENAVAGVQAALAGFGAAGKVPEGAGALYGVGAAMRQQQAQRQEQQKMKLEQRRELSDEQLAQAQIAHLNAEQYNIERGWRNADRETQQKLTEADIAASQPLVDAGVQSYGKGKTSEELSKMLKIGPDGKAEINGHEVTPFRDGMREVIGADGKPLLDQDGLPMMRPTYSIFDANGEVNLDDAQAKFLADNTPYHPTAGPMDITKYASLYTMAKKNNAQALDIAAKQASIRKDTAQAEEAEGKVTSAADQKVLTAQAASILTPYLAHTNGNFAQAWELLNKRGTPQEVGTVNQAYGDGVLQGYVQKQQEFEEKVREDEEKKKATADYTGDPNAATPQQFLDSLGPSERETVKMIGEGRVPLNSPTYLLARKPEIMDAVARAYPGFDASKVKSYQDIYKDFTSGKTSVALNAGGTVIQHLSELKAINDANPEQVRIPGTKPNVAYQNKVDTVAAELARFYGTDTVSGIASIKKTLDPVNPFASRDTAITTQANSMADKLNQYETQWHSAAPSAAYQAPLPGISDASKVALAVLRGTLTATGPNGQKLVLRNGKWVPAQ